MVAHGPLQRLRQESYTLIIKERGYIDLCRTTWTSKRPSEYRNNTTDQKMYISKVSDQSQASVKAVTFDAVGK